MHRADCDQLAELQSHARSASSMRYGAKLLGGLLSWWSGWRRTIAADLLRDITTILANEKVKRAGRRQPAAIPVSGWQPSI
ncbi:hypothetical protein LNP74_05950 [Klebsiella pneumoniae subsp. pneumoniae]|nr:hypothetical protein [Klebsiella pneumoniae subsp. pneumoniae]